MANNEGSDRRAFLRRAALGAAVAAEAARPQTPANNPNTSAAPIAPGHVEPDYSPAHGVISYPRVFTGRQLEQIAFPLGGVAAGSLSLGGRGQLRDWEIFNRPNKGFSPEGRI